MSIVQTIQTHVQEGRLQWIEPLNDDPVERLMAVSDDIWSLIEGPWPDRSIERRANRLRADLEFFVQGQKLAMSLIPYHHGTAYMGRLDRPEDEVWDIRSRDPNPGLRVFGRFAEPNVFVGLTWRPRSVKWLSQNPMRAGNSLEYHLEILKCQQRWSELFPDTSAIHGNTIYDYITENAFPVGDSGP